MTGSPDDAAKAAPEPLTAETVSAWLRRHSEFLLENPEVLSFLTPPEYRRGERIVDMQRFMLDRLREEVTTLRRREKQLLSAAEGNAAGQNKVHQAVLAIVGAPDLETLGQVIRTKLPAILDLEAAVLCAEQRGDADLAELTAIGDKRIADLMGAKRRILLKAGTAGPDFVFGDDAGRVKSVAYLRLRTGNGAPGLMLALGSGRDDGFEPHQATDLLAFMGDVLEARLRQCRDRAA